MPRGHFQWVGSVRDGNPDGKRGSEPRNEGLQEENLGKGEASTNAAVEREGTSTAVSRIVCVLERKSATAPERARGGYRPTSELPVIRETRFSLLMCLASATT